MNPGRADHSQIEFLLMAISEFEANLTSRSSIQVARLYFLLKDEELQPTLMDDLYRSGVPTLSLLLCPSPTFSPSGLIPQTQLQLMLDSRHLRNKIFYRAPSWQEVTTDVDAVEVHKALMKWSRK